MDGAEKDLRMRPEVRWTLGCLVGASALLGVAILVSVVAFALQPPVWVQVLIGVAVAIGCALFTWLVASALGGARARDSARGPWSRVGDDPS